MCPTDGSTPGDGTKSTATSQSTSKCLNTAESRYQHASQVGAKRAMLKATISELMPLAAQLADDAVCLANASSYGTLNTHALNRLATGRESIRGTASEIDSVLFRVAVEGASLAADVSGLAACQCHSSLPSRESS